MQLKQHPLTSKPLWLWTSMVEGSNVRVTEPLRAEYVFGNGSRRDWPFLYAVDRAPCTNRPTMS